ncbi:flagellar basal body-associated FliL family protein [Acidaminobacter hydrogenoformans]|uniref:Flagellar protein FliL n=1 Tax=Acidaminobacter hydrogenoformans DSM 2784 TaxID=1120920 RepID=A0A1G5RVM7_9FIRM|nr:flagellar basal body-associated FliL family protein [Acidaminobacter hydrogenoformans]SCZ77780.1 Flagellar basal body-associated protein FliL [Acidaminobacter hydrogenoformans DSM 2784]
MEARLKAQELPMDTAPTKKRFSWLQKFMLILLIVILAAGAAALGVYYRNTGALPFGLQSFLEKPQVELTLPLDSFLVNLKDDRAMHYLKTSIVLSYMDSGDREVIEQSMPQIRDIVIQHLRGLSKNDLAGADRLEVLRLDLLDRINLIFGRDIVYSLYFSDFLIQ